MYSNFPFLCEENLGEVYERGQQLVHDFNRFNNIKNDVSKLEKAKERTYQEFSKLIMEWTRKRTKLEFNPIPIALFYHKDEESYGQIDEIGKVLLKSAISQSKITRMPVILIGCEKKLEKFSTIVPIMKKGSYWDKRREKLCGKLDKTISNIKRLRSESENINIDLKERENLLTKMSEKYEKLYRKHSFIEWSLEEARETRDILQEKYEEKRDKLQPKIKGLLKCGVALDVFKEWYYDQKVIEEVSKIKPEIIDYWRDEDIIQLVEESKNIDNLNQTITVLSGKTSLFEKELKRVENLTVKLKQIV